MKNPGAVPSNATSGPSPCGPRKRVNNAPSSSDGRCPRNRSFPPQQGLVASILSQRSLSLVMPWTARGPKLLSNGGFRLLFLLLSRSEWLFEVLLRPTSASPHLQSCRHAYLSYPSATADGVGAGPPCAKGSRFRAAYIRFRSSVVTAWGAGDIYGQLGRAPHRSRGLAQEVRGLRGRAVVVVSAGGEHSCALTAGAKVWVFGRGDQGQLGTRRFPRDGSRGESSTATPALVAGFACRGLGAGERFTCAVRGDGGIFLWGTPFMESLGLGRAYGVPRRVPFNLPTSRGPRPVPLIRRPVHVTCCANKSASSLPSSVLSASCFLPHLQPVQVEGVAT